MEVDELSLVAPQMPVVPVTPPVAPRRPSVHQSHGVSRVDDYAWLQDLDDPQAAAYLRAEQAHYRQATRRLAAGQAVLAAEMAARTPATEESLPWRRHGRTYLTRSWQGERHPRLFRVEPETGREHLVLDPNRAVPEGVPLELGVVEPSPDGALIAYSVDLTGSGLFELRFRDVRRDVDLPDRIPACCQGGVWSSDSTRFFYLAADPAARAHRVRQHRLGWPAHEDLIVVDESDRRFEVALRGSPDGRWIVITSASPDAAEVSLLDADDPDAPLRLVAPRRPGHDYRVSVLPGGWDGAGQDLLLVVTDDGAPEFRLAHTRLPAPGAPGSERDWTPVPGLAHSAAERLESALVLDRHVVLRLRRDGEPFLRVVDRPAPGTLLPARPAHREVHPGLPHGQLQLWHPQDPQASRVVVVEQNLVSAPAWVEVDLASGARRVLKRTNLPHVDPSRYVTERLQAIAPDGARVPVTLARRRELRRGRTAGAVLIGHGAYEECSWPGFALSTLSLLDRDVVVALAHVRGGGELGRQWWQAARGRATPRTFVDYVAARDALVAAGWATDVRGGARVVARGRGAGGVLQAAVYSRAPRMWRAVVAEAPFVDVVTAMSDPTLPHTVRDWAEWGDPRYSAEDFAAMLSWSPYDNPPPPHRPALLVTATAPPSRSWQGATVHDHDFVGGAPGQRRAQPYQAVKWVARLRASDDATAPSPVLLRVSSAALAPAEAAPGLRDEAEVMAWILDQLGLQVAPPVGVASGSDHAKVL